MLEKLRAQSSRLLRRLYSKYQHHPLTVLSVVCTAALTIFTAYSILRHLALQTTYFDLGLYASSIWRTTHGYDSWNSLIFPSSVGHISHFSPILAVYALAYYIIPDPITLLILQSVGVALSAIPLYLLALHESHRRGLSIGIVGLLFASPALQGLVRYDFHVEAFLPLFILSLNYAYKAGKSRTYYISLALMLATIDYTAIIGVAIAISLWFESKVLDKRILTLLLTSTTLLFIILASNAGLLPIPGWPRDWLTRQLIGGSSTGRPQDYYQPYLGFIPQLGAVQHDILLKLGYLGVVFLPAGLAPIRFPMRILPALPWTLAVLSSQRVPFYSFGFQYGAFLIPFVFISAIPFLSSLNMRRILRFVAITFVLTAACSPLVWWAPLTGEPWPAPSPLLQCIASVRAALPTNATLLIQNELFPQVSNLPYATINNTSPTIPQYILVDVNSGWYNWTDPPLGVTVTMRQQVTSLLNRTSYSLAVDDQGLRLYRLTSTPAIQVNNC